METDLMSLSKVGRNVSEYFQKVEEMHAQLKADMEKLNDSFQTADPKKKKTGNKGKKKNDQ